MVGKRVFLVLVAVLLGAAISSGVVYAKGPNLPSHPGKSLQASDHIDGSITSVDVQAKSLKAKTSSGEVTIKAQDKTSIKMGRKKLEFSALRVGERISALGKLDRKTNIMDATMIRVRAKAKGK
jgi:hypothetical protein